MTATLTGATSAETAAHAILRAVAEMPGQMGRLRVARLVGGYAVGGVTPLPDADSYAITLEWPLRETVRLVDALLSGALMAQTVGARPTLVLTRAGHRALDALESTGECRLPSLEDDSAGPG